VPLAQVYETSCNLTHPNIVMVELGLILKFFQNLASLIINLILKEKNHSKFNNFAFVDQIIVKKQTCTSPC
jgi:hypothetical protein